MKEGNVDPTIPYTIRKITILPVKGNSTDLLGKGIYGINSFG